jgi:hypothetical protein
MRLISPLCAFAVVSGIIFFGGVSLSGTARPVQGKGGKGPVLTVSQVEPETGEIDSRLAEALNALGGSRYEECRRLAHALIKASGNADTRADCVGIIILSHLHQGDFAAARGAAGHLRSVSADVCQEGAWR